MNKKRWVAISVATEEALRLCLADGNLVIAVEEPLYPEIKKHWSDYEGISDYELTEYETIRCIIMKRVRGERTFDDSRFEIYYFPFYRL